MRVTYRNMVKTTYLKDKNGMPMDNQDILAHFGLKPNSPIPRTMSDTRRIGEVWVWIVPARMKGRLGYPKRRVLAMCPRCQASVCAGHLHQHVGQRTCVDGSVARRQARIREAYRLAYEEIK
jgi:hypothetical protein